MINIGVPSIILIFAAYMFLGPSKFSKFKHVINKTSRVHKGFRKWF